VHPDQGRLAGRFGVLYVSCHPYIALARFGKAPLFSEG
jgi:hypothetical protein